MTFDFLVPAERSYPKTLSFIEAQKSYPSNDGKTRIPVLSSILIDPDGHVVELNDLLMDPEDL